MAIFPSTQLTEYKPILDFKGNPVGDREKHFAILTYDVGNSGSSLYLKKFE
jgi:hypothetical protein